MDDGTGGDLADLLEQMALTYSQAFFTQRGMLHSVCTDLPAQFAGIDPAEVWSGLFLVALAACECPYGPSLRTLVLTGHHVPVCRPQQLHITS